jgi:hypothetical protein
MTSKLLFLKPKLRARREEQVSTVEQEIYFVHLSKGSIAIGERRVFYHLTPTHISLELNLILNGWVINLV